MFQITHTSARFGGKLSWVQKDSTHFFMILSTFLYVFYDSCMLRALFFQQKSKKEQLLSVSVQQTVVQTYLNYRERSLLGDSFLQPQGTVS